MNDSNSVIEGAPEQSSLRDLRHPYPDGEAPKLMLACTCTSLHNNIAAEESDV